MSSETISIITPSYNQGHFIERTILSVLNQGIPDLELIVVDGGSADETVAILQKYEDRIRWVSERDKGQADAVNKGIRLSSGEIIGWLNSDDIYYPGALKAVLQCFHDNPVAIAVYGDAHHIDTSDKMIEPYYTEDWDYERLKEVCFICQPAAFFRRRATRLVGYLDASLRYCMDYEYWLRLGEKFPFVRLKRMLAGSRMYPENKTLADRMAVHWEINHMLRRRLGRVPDRWIFNFAHAAADQRGLTRSTPLEDLRYTLCLVREGTVAFLRWRGYVPFSGLKIMGRWVMAAVKHALNSWSVK